MRPWFALVMLGALGCASDAIASVLELRGVCIDPAYKRDAAGALLVRCEGKTVLRIVNPCNGLTVRAYWGTGGRNYLTCGTLENPLVHAPPPANQVVNLR